MSTSPKDILAPFLVGCLLAITVVWVVGRLDRSGAASQAASHRAALAQTQASRAQGHATAVTSLAETLSVAEKNTCQQVQQLTEVIRQVLHQSLGTLGRKGGAGYGYYRAHPGELAVARLQLRQEIARFTPRRCG